MSLYSDSFEKIKEYGEVVEVMHPIIVVVGLPNIKSDEVVIFENGEQGKVQSISKDSISILLFSQNQVVVGQKVTRLDLMMQLRVKNGGVLGKIVDGLGKVVGNMDQNSENKDEEFSSRQIDIHPPSMDQRVPTQGQFLTGVSIIDTLIPIGVGQRELVVGDRKTGKTSFLLTIMKNHVENGGVVVYVNIGSNISDTKKIEGFIKQHKLQNKVTLVSTSSSSAHGFILVAPFTGMTIAEHYKSAGENVVIILDDLSTHAMYYREVSILSRRFPGRDSYPGDIFYLHARLLERAGSFSYKGSEKGSITCFPVALTMQNDLSDYIVSNLISITDGHILFDPNEFVKGRRPAINIALSVTRLGRQTQNTLLQDINRQLSSFLTSKYEKSVQLSHFGSELTDDVKRNLEIGNDLYGYFNQNIDTIVPIGPSIVFLSMVWLDIFRGEDITKIMVFRDIFVKAYLKDDKVRQFVDKNTKVKDFKSLLVSIMGEKEFLVASCKIKRV